MSLASNFSKHYYVNAFHDEFSWLDFTNDKFHEIEFHIAKELKERISNFHKSHLSKTSEVEGHCNN